VYRSCGIIPNIIKEYHISVYRINNRPALI
jgi:hypothetical protein